MLVLCKHAQFSFVYWKIVLLGSKISTYLLPSLKVKTSFHSVPALFIERDNEAPPSATVYVTKLWFLKVY